MKQTINLTVGAIISESDCWSPLTKPWITRVKKILDYGVAYLKGVRSTIYTGLAILLVIGVFTSGSYLFFLQLARYGW